MIAIAQPLIKFNDGQHQATIEEAKNPTLPWLHPTLISGMS